MKRTLYKYFLIINEKQIMEIEHHHFKTPSKLMDLGTECQWLLISRKVRQSEIMTPKERIQHHL